MTSRLVILFIAALASSAAAGPWVPYNAEVESRNAVSIDAYKKIDFLAPSNTPQSPDLTECTVSYEVFPSFKPGEHWCLLEDGARYFLKSWKTHEEGDTQRADDESRKLELPSDLAELLHQIWLNAILEAHYPRFWLSGADGELNCFGARRYRDRQLLRAEVWSPSSDLPPLWMTQAGNEVFTYARSTSSDPAHLRTYLFALRKKLFGYYEVHGQH